MMARCSFLRGLAAADGDSEAAHVRVVNADAPGDTFGGMLSEIEERAVSTNLFIVQGGYNNLLNHVPPNQTLLT